MRICREGEVGSESQNCFVACVQSLHDRVVSAIHNIKVFLGALEYHQSSPIFGDEDTGCSRGHVDNQTSDCRKCIGVVLEVCTKIWSMVIREQNACLTIPAKTFMIVWPISP